MSGGEVGPPGCSDPGEPRDERSGQASTGPGVNGNAKALRYQAGDTRYRAHDAYRLWHRTLGPTLFAWDLDLIEARRPRDEFGRFVGPPVPIAMTETTSVRTVSQVDDDRYLERIFARLRGQEATNDDGQMGFLSRLAERVGVPFFVIVHDDDLERFSVYEPKTNTLVRQTRDEHANWIRELGKEVIG